MALSPPDVVTAWLALTPSDAANGCLRFLPGSHRQQLPHVDTFAQGNLLLKGQAIQVRHDAAALPATGFGFHHVPAWFDGNDARHQTQGAVCPSVAVRNWKALRVSAWSSPQARPPCTTSAWRTAPPPPPLTPSHAWGWPSATWRRTCSRACSRRTQVGGGVIQGGALPGLARPQSSLPGSPVHSSATEDNALTSPLHINRIVQ